MWGPSAGGSRSRWYRRPRRTVPRWRDSHRRGSGLTAPPASLTIIKIGLMAAVGVTVVGICSFNRANIGTVDGVPWVIPIVLAILGAWTVLLERTRYGRYIYAIGG